MKLKQTNKVIVSKLGRAPVFNTPTNLNAAHVPTVKAPAIVGTKQRKPWGF